MDEKPKMKSRVNLGSKPNLVSKSNLVSGANMRSHVNIESRISVDSNRATGSYSNIESRVGSYETFGSGATTRSKTNQSKMLSSRVTIGSTTTIGSGKSNKQRKTSKANNQYASGIDREVDELEKEIRAERLEINDSFVAEVMSQIAQYNQEKKLSTPRSSLVPDETHQSMSGALVSLLKKSSTSVGMSLKSVLRESLGPAAQPSSSSGSISKPSQFSMTPAQISSIIRQAVIDDTKAVDELDLKQSLSMLQTKKASASRRSLASKASLKLSPSHLRPSKPTRFLNEISEENQEDIYNEMHEEREEKSEEVFVEPEPRKSKRRTFKSSVRQKYTIKDTFKSEELEGMDWYKRIYPRCRGLMRFRGLVSFVIKNLEWIEMSATEDTIFGSKLHVPKFKKRSNDLFSMDDKFIFHQDPESRTEKQLDQVAKTMNTLKCFKRYPPHIVYALAKYLRFIYVTPNRVVIRQNSEAVYVYFIIRGQVQVETEKVVGANEAFPFNVQTDAKANMGVGEEFGSVAFLQNTKRGATVSTFTKCEFLILPGDIFSMVLQPLKQELWDTVMKTLTTMPFFQNMNYKEMKECCILTKVKEYERDETVVGDLVDPELKNCYFVLTGRVALIEHLLVKEFPGKTPTVYTHEEADLDKKDILELLKTEDVDRLLRTYKIKQNVVTYGWKQQYYVSDPVAKRPKRKRTPAKRRIAACDDTSITSSASLKLRKSSLSQSTMSYGSYGSCKSVASSKSSSIHNRFTQDSESMNIDNRRSTRTSKKLDKKVSYLAASLYVATTGQSVSCRRRSPTLRNLKFSKTSVTKSDVVTTSDGNVILSKKMIKKANLMSIRKSSLAKSTDSVHPKIRKTVRVLNMKPQQKSTRKRSTSVVSVPRSITSCKSRLSVEQIQALLRTGLNWTPAESNCEQNSLDSLIMKGAQKDKEKYYAELVLPKYVRSYFMQIGLYERGACIAIGENMRRRRVVAMYPSIVLQIPRYFIMSLNSNWRRTITLLERVLPTTEQVFKTFMEARRFAKYKAELMKKYKKPQTFNNSENIPYSIRIRQSYFVDGQCF